jgi:hypothetical protein
MMHFIPSAPAPNNDNDAIAQAWPAEQDESRRAYENAVDRAHADRIAVYVLKQYECLLHADARRDLFGSPENFGITRRCGR